ncbi:unnamed protein product [Notodromas monacha]|uniref:Fatty acid hydroxylase domain-containing protein n=1 Tax=Notodromas monacha TaxID=399045 RepID=A0A7R9BWV9_9CRUS|nr:unnamed protein product [Notodromas monacha]CAG0921884.1 unnamed protein product [Notodromas monacha]
MKRYIASLVVFILGCTISGEWVFLLAYWTKNPVANINDMGSVHGSPDERSFLERWNLQGFPKIWLMANLFGFFGYFGIGGWLQWYFYFRRRETPSEWKCQPNRWITPELERHEIKWGSITLVITNFFSAVLSAHVINGGWSMIYYQLDEYGWTWFFLQWPVIFLLQDYAIYWNHRLFHVPFFYKNFHKLHHSYKVPTAYSVTAIHPVECVFFQTLYVLPVFTIPCHWAVYCTLLGYIYYHGILDHSGIRMKSMWPWQPETTFHDNHHQYFHVNFGFNFYLWDVIHGTMRRKDRVYREEIWSQKGLSLAEVSEEVLKEELAERESENRADKAELTDFLKSKLA